MNIKALIYPAPSASYSESSFFGELIYVPRSYHKDETTKTELIKDTID